MASEIDCAVADPRYNLVFMFMETFGSLKLGLFRTAPLKVIVYINPQSKHSVHYSGVDFINCSSYCFFRFGVIVFPAIGCGRDSNDQCPTHIQVPLQHWLSHQKDT